MVALIESDHFQNDPLQTLAMFEVVDEVCKKEDGSLVFQFENQIAIIFSANSHSQAHYDSVFKKQTYRKAEQIRAYLEKYNFPVVLGIGNQVHRPSAISQSYRQALRALNYSSCYPEQSLFFISDLESESPEEQPGGVLQELQANVVLSVKTGNEQQVSEAVSSLFGGETLASLSLTQIQELVLSLAVSLQDLAHSYGHTLFTLSENEGRNLFAELASLTTLGKARRWFTHVCLEIREKIAGKRESSHIQFIGKAKSLITKHFTESGFGLEEICELIGGVSPPSYFSSTFKKEVGLSFVQYLTAMRMDRAKELLVKTEGKTYEIAQAVGSLNPTTSVLVSSGMWVYPPPASIDRLTDEEREATVLHHDPPDLCYCGSLHLLHALDLSNPVQSVFLPDQGECNRLNKRDRSPGKCQSELLHQ